MNECQIVSLTCRSGNVGLRTTFALIVLSDVAIYMIVLLYCMYDARHANAA